MKHLLEQVVINDPRSPFNGSRQDILILNGQIEAIGQSLDAADAHRIQMDGLVVSPGWVDPFAHFNDPGSEYKETLIPVLPLLRQAVLPGYS